MDRAELLIPILVPLAFFLLIFGIVYLRNREKMAMIERGMDPRLQVDNAGSRNYILTAGMLMIGAGTGLFLAFILEWSLKLNDAEAIYFAMIAFFGGLGLVCAYLVEKKAAINE